MGFQQGLSGLAASGRKLDVISNNIANASTVGYKQQNIQFANVVAASWNASSTQAGMGVAVSRVASSFTQGDISSTNNPLDMAINGDGFFRIDAGGSVAYTRNGEFGMDKDGYIVTASGGKLTGFQTGANGQIAAGAPGLLRLPQAAGAPSATSSMQASVNLDSRSPASSAPFSASDPSTYAYSTSMTVYDSLGNPRVASLYFASAGNGSWDVYASADGQDLGQAGQLAFNSAGQLVSGGQMSLSIPGANGSAPISAALDMSGSTQFGASSAVSKVSQNGYAPGNLSSFSISADGSIYGSYSNGQTKLLGQVALASFPSPEGLANLGNNLFGQTAQSGQPALGVPGSGQLGALQSSAVESSTVDLTQQLVEMITAQRNYQANAESIKTQDQIMQTLINLR